MEENAPSARFDKALTERILKHPSARADLSRSRIQQLIRSGYASIDGQVVKDPCLKVRSGAEMALIMPPLQPTSPAPEALPLNVIYEDDALIIIDKPAGLVVHPAPGNLSGTLVNALLAHCGSNLSTIGGIWRPGIVHRLDKGTSGVLAVAKTNKAHKVLAAQFADHGRTGPLKRAYLAICWGEPLPRSGVINVPLERMENNREKITTAARGCGREAITHYKVEEIFSSHNGAPIASLVRCELETGRTHQIRVHLTSRGHPLLGDALYGSGFRTKEKQLNETAQQALAALGRQALHATLLGFSHPETGEEMIFESPLPKKMEALWESLKYS